MFGPRTLLQLERGIAYREQKVWHTRRPTCDPGQSGDFAPVELLPVLPTFVCLALGISISSGLCLAERLAHRLAT